MREPISPLPVSIREGYATTLDPRMRGNDGPVWSHASRAAISLLADPDTERVMHEVLGLTDDEIADYAGAGVFV